MALGFWYLSVKIDNFDLLLPYATVASRIGISPSKVIQLSRKGFSRPQRSGVIKGTVMQVI